MAVPTPQAWGTVAVRLSGDATNAPGAPASVASGDLLWLRIEDQGTDGTTTLPTVSGGTETWNEHPSSPVFGSGASRLSLYWARASQASPTMPQIGSGVNHTHARVARVTGVKSTGNPWNGSEYNSGNDAAANPTIPGFSTAGVDRLVIDFVTTGFNGTSTARFSAWANTSLASPSITEWDDDCNTIGGGGGGGSSYGGMASAGTVNSTTVTEAFAGHSYIKVAVAAAGDPQTLDGTTFTKAPSFIQGALTYDQALAGSVFTKAPTFPQGAVTAEFTFTFEHFHVTPTFPAGSITTSYDLSGTVFQQAPSFPQGAIVGEGGDQDLTGALFVLAPTFPQGALQAVYDLAGSTFTEPPVFPTGTIETTYDLAGSTFAQAPSFPQGQVLQAGPQDVTGVLFARAPTFPQGQLFVGGMGTPVQEAMAVIGSTDGQAVMGRPEWQLWIP